LPEINIESIKKFENAKNRKMPVFTKKFINFLFLHITGQKFNTILVSYTLSKLYFKGKNRYQSIFKKSIYFEK